MESILLSLHKANRDISAERLELPERKAPSEAGYYSMITRPWELVTKTPAACRLVQTPCPVC